MSSLLLFDLDGTLTNPALGIFNCIRHAFEQLGQASPADDQLSAWVGPPLLDSFATAFDGDRPLAERALAAYRERFAEVGLFENEMVSGIDGLLGQLSNRGHRCVVATAKPTVYSSRIVEYFGLSQYLPEVYGSELDGTRANKSELIAYIMQTECADPAQAVMIGDRKHDVIGARDNGVISVGVLWGFGDEQELKSAHADHIVADLPGLARAISAAG